MSRTDKIRQVAQQAHDNGDCDCVTITTNVAIQADEQPTSTDSAANDHERSDTVEQPSVTKLDAGSSFATATHPESGVERSGTVTIKISREDAQAIIAGPRMGKVFRDASAREYEAIRAALERKR